MVGGDDRGLGSTGGAALVRGMSARLHHVGRAEGALDARARGVSLSSQTRLSSCRSPLLVVVWSRKWLDLSPLARGSPEVLPLHVRMSV